jgi:hypothetical protein
MKHHRSKSKTLKQCKRKRIKVTFTTLELKSPPREGSYVQLEIFKLSPELDKLMKMIGW